MNSACPGVSDLPHCHRLPRVWRPTGGVCLTAEVFGPLLVGQTGRRFVVGARTGFVRFMSAAASHDVS